VDRTDEQLARASMTGDANAFGILVGRLRSPLTGYLGGLLGRRGDDVEELAQETFLIAWQKIPGLRNPGSVSHWVYRIARNLATKHFKAKRPLPLTDDPPARDTDDFRAQRLASLVAAVGQLEEPQRDVVLRKHFSGDSGEKIAADLDIARGTVWSRLSRAYGELRAMLAEEETPERKRSG
jgi:RNA polymerase sigma factor (sigma-70 family)